MLPTQDTNHVAEGLSYRLSQSLSDANLAAALTSFLNLVQETENMLWAVYASQQLGTYSPAALLAAGLGPGGPATQGYSDGPPPQALLQLADLVGCPVGLLTTAQLAFFLTIWRLARRSKGRSEDLLGILEAAFGNAGFSYAEYPLLAYQANAIGIPDLGLIPSLGQALTIARPPTVYAILGYTTDPASEVFYFGDPYGSDPGSGLADPYAMPIANAKGLLETEVC